MTLMNESTYLPSIVAELPAGDWLVLAPHPDDESFGMGGTLLLALAADINVDVIFLTDGSAAQLDNKQLVEKREIEAKTACEQLGIRNLQFWREIDRELSTSQHLISRLSDFINENHYSTVFFPSPQEPHPDHRISAVLAWESLRQLKFSAIPISYEISLQAYTNQLIDISPVIAQKEQIMMCYASQMTSNHYIARILGLNQSRAWSLPLSVSHAEAFYIWPKEDRPLNAMLLSIASQQFSLQALPQSSPLVSVITRTQNRPHFLRESIRSIAAQTYPNIELIVINDGGDNCYQLVQEEAIGHIQSFQYQHLKIQTGRSHAANTGLDLCQGEYICFLDDDDLLAAEHLHNLISYMHNHPSKVVYSGTQVIAVQQDGLTNEVAEYNVDFSAERLFFENYIPIHSVLFHKDLLDKETQFDTAFNFFEDWDFWLQLSQKVPFAHSPAVTAIYRLHGSSSGVHHTGNEADAYLQIYSKWLSKFSKQKILSLIKVSHQWHNDDISVLQQSNAAKLDEIGQKHSYALKIIQQRDNQLQALNNQHDYALSIVQERDKQLQLLNSQLQEIGKQHQHALDIIQERDKQLQELTQQHDYTLNIVQQRDQQLEQINSRKLINRLKSL